MRPARVCRCWGSSLSPHDLCSGRTHNSKGFTRIDTTGCSVVDYVLCTERSYAFLSNFKVGQKVPESDHLPLLMEISCIKNEDNNCNDKPVISFHKHYKYVWNNETINDFVTQLDDTTSTKYINELYNVMTELCSPDTIAECFHNYLSQVCDRTFVRKITNNKCKKRSAAAWFDKECKIKRTLAIKAGGQIDTIGKDEVLRICKDYKKKTETVQKRST